MNFPAVDLFDTKSLMTIQVTSENNTGKIYETIDKYLALEEVKTKKFSGLKFFILNRINYTTTQWAHIEKKYKDNGLEFSKSETIVDIDTFIKQARRLPESTIDQLIKEIDHSLGLPYEMDMKEKFDRATFEKFNGIINEERLVGFVGILHGGRPCLSILNFMMNVLVHIHNL